MEAEWIKDRFRYCYLGLFEALVYNQIDTESGHNASTSRFRDYTEICCPIFILSFYLFLPLYPQSWWKFVNGIEFLKLSLYSSNWSPFEKESRLGGSKGSKRCFLEHLAYCPGRVAAPRNCWRQQADLEMNDCTTGYLPVSALWMLWLSNQLAWGCAAQLVAWLFFLVTTRGSSICWARRASPPGDDENWFSWRPWQSATSYPTTKRSGLQ